MRFHTIYRTTGSENRKARPEWYSKSLAFESYLGSLAAVAAAGDLVFLVDGPMADAELVRFRRAGEVVQLSDVDDALRLIEAYARSLRSESSFLR